MLTPNTQCWTTSPLPQLDRAQLRQVAVLGGHLVAALPLLAWELGASVGAASFLPHTYASEEPSEQQLPSPGVGTGAGTGGPTPQNMVQALDANAATWYHQQVLSCSAWGVSHHLKLKGAEEERVLGVRLPLPDPPECLRRRLCQQVDVPDCPVPSNTVAESEQMLLTLIVPAGKAATKAPPYPLKPTSTNNPLEAEMHKELKASWDLYHSITPSTQVKPHCATTIKSLPSLVKQQRLEVHAYLLHHINAVPSQLEPWGASYRLSRLGRTCHTGVSQRTLLSIALDPSLLLSLNPFLSPSAWDKLAQSVLLWGQLCVLEDRLGRIEALVEGAAGNHTHALIQVSVAPCMRNIACTHLRLRLCMLMFSIL